MTRLSRSLLVPVFQAVAGEPLLKPKWLSVHRVNSHSMKSSSLQAVKLTKVTKAGLLHLLSVKAHKIFCVKMQTNSEKSMEIIM